MPRFESAFDCLPLVDWGVAGFDLIVLADPLSSLAVARSSATLGSGLTEGDMIPISFGVEGAVNAFRDEFSGL